MTLKHYNTTQLRSFLHELDRLRKEDPVCWLFQCSPWCWNGRRDGFPACSVCIAAEIERRQQPAPHGRAKIMKAMRKTDKDGSS